MAKKQNLGISILYPALYDATTLKEDFLNKTIEIWQPYSKTKLSLEDAREITANMVSLYSYLIELDQKYGHKPLVEVKAVSYNERPILEVRK